MRKTYSAKTATAVIIANMVGSGVFVALGFQLATIQSPFLIVMLWALGGLIAICGALSYAELGAQLPRSGGEYNFLTEIYHPAAGFVSGWISATVGFAAPAAAVAIAFAAYATPWMEGAQGPIQQLIACGLIIVCALFHMFSRRQSAGFQNIFTLFKIGFILFFVIGGFLLAPDKQAVSFMPEQGDLSAAIIGPFFVALIYVSYAYSGWNAATYISGELDNAQKSLPKVLLAGTALVTVLYVALNAFFLSVAPIEALTSTGDEVRVGFIAAKYAFGEGMAGVMSFIIAALLVSSVSAMTLAGPRALQMIGQDYPKLKWLATTNEDGLPFRAIAFQSMVAITLILTASFKAILVFAAALLALNTLLAVFGVIILRMREPQAERPFKAPLYPLPPLIYVGLNIALLIFVLQDNPASGLWALGIILAGLLAWFFVKTKD